MSIPDSKPKLEWSERWIHITNWIIFQNDICLPFVFVTFWCPFLVFIFVLFLPSTTGTESERSFSGRDSHRRLLRQSATAVPGGSAIKPMKIAAINGKPKVSRYLSKECKFSFIFIFLHAIFSMCAFFHACLVACFRFFVLYWYLPWGTPNPS